MGRIPGWWILRWTQGAFQGVSTSTPLRDFSIRADLEGRRVRLKSDVLDHSLASTPGPQVSGPSAVGRVVKPGLRTENWSYLRPFLPHRSGLRVSIVSLSSFLGGLAESAVLVIVALTANALIGGDRRLSLGGVELTLTEAVAVAFVMVVGRVITTLTGSFFAARFSALVMLKAQQSLAAAYLRSSHAARSARNLGDLSTVAVNHGRFMGDLATAYTNLATAFCGLIAFGGMSLVVNPVATMGIAVVGAGVIALMRPLRKRNKAASANFTEVSRTLGAEATQLELLHREIEVFQIGDKVLENLGVQFRVGSERLERLRFISGSIPQIFQASLLGAAVLSLLAVVNTSEGADLAAIGAVVLLLIRAMSATQQVVTARQQVVERGAYGREVTMMIDTHPAEERVFGSVVPDTLSPVVLKDVDFSYSGDELVLRDLNLELKAGELVGVVGPSGAGKSTLVELLLRLRQPTRGSIIFNSVPVDDVDPKAFGRRVAFVPQKAVLINGTVAENVDFFRGLPREKIRSALLGAHLQDEIDALPEGMDTMLGPGSRSLSGGQQQRLTIARALAGDPEILILDEPTSALDAVSDEAVRRTLNELPTGRVVIIVAHRYSTLSSCSRILVIEDGELRVDATPGEVASQSEFFRVMVGDQG